MHRFIRPPVLLALALALSGCQILTAPDVVREGDVVKGTGTVLWYDLEGGFYAIEGDDRETYDPINLPETFKEDGLRVWFEAKIRDDLMSIHMAGPIVEITKITRR